MHEERIERDQSQEEVRSEETTLSSQVGPEDESGRDIRVEGRQSGKDKLQKERDGGKGNGPFKASVALSRVLTNMVTLKHCNKGCARG